jgi:WD40 repeat protein
MRIIDLEARPVRTVAVSPDGRFVAASSGGWYAVYDWASGEMVHRLSLGTACDQIAFSPGDVAWYVQYEALRFDRLEDTPLPPRVTDSFAGGVAVSPDGKTLVATRSGYANKVKLACWSLPAMRRQAGFDYWSPFRKLAFSPNGQFLAGIWPGGTPPHPFHPATFELRYAVSGGADYRYSPMGSRKSDSPGFISFTRDSSLCAFGWEGEFRVLDISTGTTSSHQPRRVEAEFRDAAFTGSGQHFATVGADGRLKLWDTKSWEVVREYDWGCGPLTCLAFTADGSAGVCGTADGWLVQFDVDE